MLRKYNFFSNTVQNLTIKTIKIFRIFFEKIFNKKKIFFFLFSKIQNIKTKNTKKVQKIRMPDLGEKTTADFMNVYDKKKNITAKIK